MVGFKSSVQLSSYLDTNMSNTIFFLLENSPRCCLVLFKCMEYGKEYSIQRHLLFSVLYIPNIL